MSCEGSHMDDPVLADHARNLASHASDTLTVGGCTDIADSVVRDSDLDLGGTLSDRALALVDGPRQDAYAAPEVNLSRIGAMWAAILGRDEPVEPWRVALMMASLKIARAAHRPDDDSLVDAVGYLELVERLR